MATGTLDASGQSAVELGINLDISLSGTWAGTVKLQRFMASGWRDTGDSWTANGEFLANSATRNKWRLDWTRVSGSLVYDLRGDVA